MAPTIVINTPLTGNIPAESLIATLQSHETYIRTTCPQLISFEHESGNPNSSEPCVYRVTDKKPIGQTTYTLTLTNTVDGINTLVNAKPPIGTLVIKGEWRVVDGKLTESVDIDANPIMKKMVKGNVEKSHSEHHVSLMNIARAS